MIVQGYTVPAEVEARLVERMRVAEFTQGDIYRMAQEVSFPLPYELSDALVEREHRAKNISRRRVEHLIVWSWRHPPSTTPAGGE